MAKVKKPSCVKTSTLNHTFLVKEINKTLNGHDPDLNPHEIKMNLKSYKENSVDVKRLVQSHVMTTRQFQLQ